MFLDQLYDISFNYSDLITDGYGIDIYLLKGQDGYRLSTHMINGYTVIGETNLLDDSDNQINQVSDYFQSLI